MTQDKIKVAYLENKKIGREEKSPQDLLVFSCDAQHCDVAHCGYFSVSLYRRK